MSLFSKAPRCISEIREARNHWQRITSASDRLAHASLYIRHSKKTDVAELQAANMLLRLSVEILKEDIDRSFR